MVRWCIDVLRADMINKISLIAFRDNDIGNSFWKKNGWKFRDDLNYYDYTLNPKQYSIQWKRPYGMQDIQLIDSYMQNYIER